VPFATRLIDRRFVHKTVLTVTAALSTVGYAIMGIAQGFLAIAAAYVAISVVSAPLLPLSDSYGLARAQCSRARLRAGAVMGGRLRLFLPMR
jgi:hypothetical protein